MNPIENKSEIVNQKKQFIFEVEQTAYHVFPNEQYKYYLYIKNISGSVIDHFTIKIQNNPEIIFEETNNESDNLVLNVNETKLYTFKAHCESVGDFFVHFIGYGEGTQIICRTLKIRCDRTYNSDKLTHRIHFYNFTPYEDKYRMEASDYSEDATELTKIQKLPYKAKTQPFNISKNISFIENEESLSYLNQYDEAKNTEEHVYQYIGRENFNALESYEGETLAEIFDKINKNSDYFKGNFFRSGTNHLINDFMQCVPNGFIYRMGLLNSEIYHNLGVLPTYTYMSDYLFRWAPEEHQLLDLIPQKEAKRWNRHVWAGKGYIVYKIPTSDFIKTEEYIQGIEDGTETSKEILRSFESKETAEEYVKKLKEWDEVIRNRLNSDIVKYKYNIIESLYDHGVFFVNIPINKVPSNFYLVEHEFLEKLINRAKPFGAKAVINYVIEEIFNQELEFKPFIYYNKYFDFKMNPQHYLYSVAQNTHVQATTTCNGVETNYIALVPSRVVNMFDMELSSDIELDVDSSRIGMNSNLDLDFEDEYSVVKTTKDYGLKTLEDSLDLLYQNNYNEICFYMDTLKYSYINLPTTEEKIQFTENEDEYTCLKFQKNSKQIIHPIEGLRLQVTNKNDYKKNKAKLVLEITDSYNKKHKICTQYNETHKMDYITYTYTNLHDKEFIRNKGYQNIKSINVIIEKVKNKKLLIFMIEDKNKTLHYFHHILVQDISYLKAYKEIKNQEINLLDGVLYSLNIKEQPITIETPFIKSTEKYTHNLIENGNNWINIARINDDTNSYTYITNEANNFITPNDINLFYDDISIPETAIIEKLQLNIKGSISDSKDKVYISKAFNSNYLTNDVDGYEIQLEPEKIECYSNYRESNVYYENKLKIAEENEYTTLIKEYNKLIEENIIFNEDIDVEVVDYLSSPNDFITINKEFWYELSDFNELYHSLNDVNTMSLVIEGYNSYYEKNLITQALYNGKESTPTSQTIPSGYFRKKIPLLFPNKFLLEDLRVRFRFDNLNHDIKIFDTKLEIEFSRKQEGILSYDFSNEIQINENTFIDLTENYLSPDKLNNGLSINLSFDDLKPGAFYKISSVELEVIYQKTDVDLILTNKQYQDTFYKQNKSMVSGISQGYLSGSFYNDVRTREQYQDNIGINNKGIKLQKALYQMFETRDDNITGIEIYPYSFVGNPDSMLKIALYNNSYNTPGELLKEIYIDGWLKNNEELRNLGKIKYNFNITNLRKNTKYWFKIEILDERENSYYLLKGINNTKPGFKLLAEENNNYINTFGNLKFNIYSKNLSKSFNSLPALQEYFNNPFVSIGLHKGEGYIKDLQVNKYENTVEGDKHMSDVFDEEQKLEVFKIIRDKNGTTEELPTEEE